MYSHVGKGREIRRNKKRIYIASYATQQADSLPPFSIVTLWSCLPGPAVLPPTAASAWLKKVLTDVSLAVGGRPPTYTRRAWRVACWEWVPACGRIPGGGGCRMKVGNIRDGGHRQPWWVVVWSVSHTGVASVSAAASKPLLQQCLHCLTTSHQNRPPQQQTRLT